MNRANVSSHAGDSPPVDPPARAECPPQRRHLPRHDPLELDAVFGELRRLAASSSPSRLISSGLPANAENNWYGDSPYPTGPSGSTCQMRLSFRRQPVRETVRLRSQIADPVSTRQRCRMQQNSARPHTRFPGKRTAALTPQLSEASQPHSTRCHSVRRIADVGARRSRTIGG